MTFVVEITDLAGTLKDTISERDDLSVEIPLNDSRQGSLRIPLAHASEVRPLDRMIRAFYRQADNSDPIAWGVIDDPDWHLGEGYVEVPFQDQWFRLERAFARFGDVVVGASVDPHPPDSPTDYTTIRNLILAAENTAAQALAGDPDLGIKRTGAGTSNSASAAAAGYTMQIERGSNIAQKIHEIAKGAYGPDVVLYPKLGLGATPSGTPYYTALRTYDFQGTDRTAGPGALTFYCQDPEDPAHPNNIENAGWNPQGSLTRNHHTSVIQGDATHPGVRTQASHAGSFAQYGPLSGWDNPSGQNAKLLSNATLEGHAASVLERYAKPPNFITLTAKPEAAVGSNPNPQWLRDFDVGDLVNVVIAKEHLVFSGAVRIVSVKPTQIDSADNVRVDIDVVPHTADQADIATAVDS